MGDAGQPHPDPRVYQRGAHSEALNRWLHSLGERIESTFHEVQNTGRSLARLLRKTVIGLVTQVIAKMISPMRKHFLCRDFGIDVQTCTMRPV